MGHYVFQAGLIEKGRWLYQNSWMDLDLIFATRVAKIDSPTSGGTEEQSYASKTGGTTTTARPHSVGRKNREKI